MPEIKEVIEEAENQLGQEGRILVRYSGTERLCRVMVEGRSEREVKDLAEKIAAVIKSKLN